MGAHHGILYIDGAAKGNPGPAGCGVLVLIGDEVVFEGAFYLGRATNNTAEYQGLLHGLAKAKELGLTDLEVRSDSELLVRQMNREYKVKAPHLKRLVRQAERAAAVFDSVAYVHVPREENHRADGLANRAIERAR